jgi:hypothetical protein
MYHNLIKHMLTYILSMMFVCCSNKLISLENLTFNDFEKLSIEINNVDTIWGISYSINDSLSIDTAMYIYDIKGNLIEQKTGFGFSSNSTVYKYDNLGLVVSKKFFTDYLAEYKCSYRFFSDSLLLYQYWSGNATDTCVFKFNTAGQNIESKIYENSSGKGWLHFITYQFDENNRLKIIVDSNSIDPKTRKHYEKDFNLQFPIKYITELFYHNSDLDSSITNSYYTNLKIIERYKTIYSPTGLKKFTITSHSFTEYSYSKR